MKRRLSREEVIPEGYVTVSELANKLGVSSTDLSAQVSNDLARLERLPKDKLNDLLKNWKTDFPYLGLINPYYQNSQIVNPYANIKWIVHEKFGAERFLNRKKSIEQKKDLNRKVAGFRPDEVRRILSHPFFSQHVVIIDGTRYLAPSGRRVLDEWRDFKNSTIPIETASSKLGISRKEAFALFSLLISEGKLKILKDPSNGLIYPSATHLLSLEDLKRFDFKQINPKIQPKLWSQSSTVAPSPIDLSELIRIKLATSVFSDAEREKATDFIGFLKVGSVDELVSKLTPAMADFKKKHQLFSAQGKKVNLTLYNALVKLLPMLAPEEKEGSYKRGK
ncbi:MAG: hypothetical protein ABH803_03170 [Candidatus Micrarchaeota archaeon]